MHHSRRNPADEKGNLIMAMYRKLGKATKPRRALLRNQVTALLYNGKIITTEARAKEVKKIVEPMITLAAKEKDNFETITVDAKVPEKDKDGKRVKEVVDGKKVTKYTTVKKEIKKDLPSRMHARRQLLRTLYPVTEVPTEKAGRKRNTKEVDLVAKLFDEYGPKYADRKGGYTRMIKIGQRKGDAAMMVVLELV
nr:50S ribosomal protein L17 [Butyrivibrio proteoclasticus]